MKTDQEIEQLARERFKLNVWKVVTPNEKIVLLDAERSFQLELAAAKLEGIKEGMRRAAELMAECCVSNCECEYCEYVQHFKVRILSAIDKQTL